MLLTEEEARGVWCSEARVWYSPSPGYPGVAVNRLSTNNTGGCNCVASKCGHWRWEAHPDKIGQRPDGSLFKRAVAPGEDSELRGYCGLSGKP